MSKLFVALGLAALALVVAACGTDDERITSAEPGSTEQSGASAGGGYGAGGGEGAGESGSGDASDAGRGTTIATGDSQYGEILFDGDRRALYYFAKETTATSECYGECAVAWPPVLTEGDPVADGAAGASLLGTTERDDGTTQVTYHGRPLYYYVDDPPGEILCHNVDEFGGLWLGVQPSGEAAQ